MIKIQHIIPSLLLLVVLLFGTTKVSAQTYWGSGSRDLYPNGVAGGRAFLYASTTESAAFPYPTLGTHYVYAEVGEQIALASSAQAYGSSNIVRNSNRINIRLFGPNGQQITLATGTNASVIGRIDTRTAELAGPQLPGQTGGSRYTPLYHTVTQAGVYRVEFLSTSRSTTGNSNRIAYVAANGSWTQSDASNYLAAWDVSVAKQTGSVWNWVSGRTYTTVFSMDNRSFNSSSQFTNNSGFYGTFKVLTRDGYVYNVNNNGNQGLSFTFMVNNRGFHEVGNTNKPSYRSISAASAAAIQGRYQDPRTADAGSAVTQKIFYQLPDSSMPENSIGAVPGGQTWLRIPEKDLNVSTINVVGVEGSASQLGIKGANIEFYNESGGDYYITIKPKTGSTTNFPTRLLTGPSAVGNNKIYWDGKDGALNPLPAGESDVTVELKLRGAEVHFPYIDMELNQNGILLELLTTNLQAVKSDIIYWNDTPIDQTVSGTKASPINASHEVLPNGTSSTVNGHKWGVGTTQTSGTWGDVQGVDTWTFIEGNSISVDLDVDIRTANLEVVSITADKSSVVAGDIVTYTTTVRNNGQSNVLGAPFALVIPEGMELASPGIYTFNGGSCGTESSPLVYNTSNNHIGYKSKLNLPAGCTVTYTIKLKVKNNIPVGNNTVYSTIMRPNDVTDPDATNNIPQDSQGNFVPPTDPFFECANNGLGGTCNNIKNTALFVRTYLITNPMIRQRTK